MVPTPVFLPRKSHRQRNLADYSPWSLKAILVPSDRDFRVLYLGLIVTVDTFWDLQAFYFVDIAVLFLRWLSIMTTRHCGHSLGGGLWGWSTAAAKSLSVMSDSVRPHRWQPTRLPRPWDSPSKNTGVGCHFLLQCMKAKRASEVILSCPSLSNPMDCSLPGSSVHGIFHARVLEWVAIALFEGDPQQIVNQKVWQWTWSLEFYHRLSLIDWKSGSGWREYKVERTLPVPNLGI